MSRRLSTLRRFAGARPVMAAVLCAGTQFLLAVLILKIGFALAPPSAFGQVKLVVFASTVLLPVLLAQALGSWRRVGLELRAVRPSTAFLAGLAPCALALAMGVRLRSGGLGDLGSEVLMQFVNAFGEELLFRGVIFALLLSLPRWQGILLSGLMFGSMHLIHGVMDGNWTAAMTQAAFTTAGGLMFAAVRYATGSLWLVIGLHMLLNLCIVFSNVEPVLGPAAWHVVGWLSTALELALAAWVMFGPPGGGSDRTLPVAQHAR
jgi:membrane protease YdiL (CAAX protease family)